MLLFLLLSCARNVPGSPPPGTETVVYTVQWGDNLTEIADRFDVKGGYSELAQLNGLWSADVIWAGQVLKIPATRQARAVLAGEPTPVELPPMEAAALALLPPPRPANVNGCLQAACTELAPGVTACSCEQGASDSMLLTRPGQPNLTWPITLPDTPNTERWHREGGTTDFTVARIDLDADGDLEYLVAHRSWTDDLERSYWRAALIESPDQAEPPLTMQLGNPGEGTAVTTEGPKAELLLTSWERFRPPGGSLEKNHLVGRRFSYDDGVLKPVSAPLRTRRLHYVFTPGKAKAELGTPILDLTTQTLGYDAEPLTWSERRQDAGKIAACQPSADGPRITLSSQGSDYELGPWDYRLGDLSTGRLYPHGFDPGDLEGGKVLVARYQVGADAQATVLWR